MVNDDDTTIRVGATSHDEMCNFYIMYYVDGDQTLTDKYCFSDGPPTWSWDDFGGLDAALAPLSASIVPGTEQFLAATRRLLDDLIAGEEPPRNDDALARLLYSLEEDYHAGGGDDYVMPYPGVFPGIPNDDVIDDDLYDDRSINYID